MSDPSDNIEPCLQTHSHCVCERPSGRHKVHRCACGGTWNKDGALDFPRMDGTFGVIQMLRDISRESLPLYIRKVEEVRDKLRKESQK